MKEEMQVWDFASREPLSKWLNGREKKEDRLLCSESTDTHKNKVASLLELLSLLFCRHS